MIIRKPIKYLLIAIFSLLLSACDTSSTEEGAKTDTRIYSVGANLTGLEGDSAVIDLNGAEAATLTFDESFTFAAGLNAGASYSISVSTQPSNPSQFCSVTNGSGTINDAIIFNGGVTIEISCVTVAALSSVNGPWLSNCVVDGVISTSSRFIMTDGNGSLEMRTYSDTTCTETSMLDEAEFTYTLGSTSSTISIDGSVDNITTATEINTIYTSGKSGSEFNIVAIKDSNTLYFGKAGTSDALRPTQLDGTVTFTKQ